MAYKYLERIPSNRFAVSLTCRKNILKIRVVSPDGSITILLISHL